jgi:competence protein ComEA
LIDLPTIPSRRGHLAVIHGWRRATDMMRMKGVAMHSLSARRLGSIVTIALGLVAASPSLAQTPQGGAAQPAVAPAAKAELIDINSAPKEELDALPGIGAARSEAIIKGRPYKRKDELVQRKILQQGVYDKIQDRIIAKQK